MAHQSSFDIKDPYDFMHKMIVPEYEDFLANNSSSRHALLAIILVYHMYEWVHHKKFRADHFRAHYKNDGEILGLFELARGVANGTKHFSSNAETHIQAGFSSGFSEGFARPLNIKLSSGEIQSVDALLDKMVAFWTRHVEAPR